MLWVPNPTRASFWARKFISLLAFEQLNVPMASPPCLSRTVRTPSAAKLSASSHEAGRRPPLSRIRGSVSRVNFIAMRDSFEMVKPQPADVRLFISSYIDQWYSRIEEDTGIEACNRPIGLTDGVRLTPFRD